MPIKQVVALSRADLDEAVVKLRANVSEIAKATGIPRTYLSEFRNQDRMLRPEHLAKLRDYFEANGVEFEDAPADDAPADAPNAARSARTKPSGRAVPQTHCSCSPRSASFSLCATTGPSDAFAAFTSGVT